MYRDKRRKDRDELDSVVLYYKAATMSQMTIFENNRAGGEGEKGHVEMIKT